MSTSHYAGFWIRVVASLIDTVCVLLVVMPLLTLIYGSDYWLSTAMFKGFWDVVLNYIFPAIAVVMFWIYKSATPGKMICKLVIVDAKTGAKPSAGQLIGRYAAYYVSLLPLCLGLIWVGIDKQKQGWHDKLAQTLVIKTVPENAEH